MEKVSIGNVTMGLLTDHIKDTDNPQTYWQHWRVAFFGSLYLIGAGLVGVMHSFCPWWFPFYTSTKVIQIMNILIKTGRHKEEIYREFGTYTIETNSEQKVNK